MTKTKSDKPVSIREELEAAKAEEKRPSKPISASLMKDVERVHEIKKLMAPFEAEIEHIRAKAFKEMDNKGVDVLTRKGVEIVTRDVSVGENWDRDSIRKKFPEVIIEFVTTRISYRVNWKKPVQF